jgi:Domain of unknown function (DUF4166)
MTTLVELGLTTDHLAPPSAPNFERLLGSDAWQRLPTAVRARFAADAHARSKTTIYVGVAVVRATLAGRVFAHLCRCIGTPVAPYVGEAVPMRVRVFRADDGIVWERHYDFAGRACIVTSTKQADGDALVEKLGAGLYMRLRTFEEGGALRFASAGYFFRIGDVKLALPDWFLPGGTHVVHDDLGCGQFRFTLRTHHPWFGEMFYQDGVFAEERAS